MVIRVDNIVSVFAWNSGVAKKHINAIRNISFIAGLALLALGTYLIHYYKSNLPAPKIYEEIFITNSRGNRVYLGRPLWDGGSLKETWTGEVTSHMRNVSLMSLGAGCLGMGTMFLIPWIQAYPVPKKEVESVTKEEEIHPNRLWTDPKFHWKRLLATMFLVTAFFISMTHLIALSMKKTLAMGSTSYGGELIYGMEKMDYSLPHWVRNHLPGTEKPIVLMSDIGTKAAGMGFLSYLAGASTVLAIGAFFVKMATFLKSKRATDRMQQNKKVGYSMINVE